MYLKMPKMHNKVCFLAAPSSSRSLFVGLLVCLSLGVCEKVTFTRVQEHHIVTIVIVVTLVTVVTVVIVVRVMTVMTIVTVVTVVRVVIVVTIIESEETNLEKKNQIYIYIYIYI